MAYQNNSDYASQSVSSSGSPISGSTISSSTIDNTNTATFKDNAFTLQDDGDTTKQAQFQLAGITTGQTRTFSLPDKTDTVAVLGLAQMFSATQTFSPAVNTSAIVVSGYSLTGANTQVLMDFTGTWNTSGTPVLIRANVTDTASSASSLLMDLQVSSGSKFAVTKTGNVRIPSTGEFYWASSSQIFAPSNGNILLQNAAATDFGLLQFGGTTASFPALKRSDTAIQFKLADDTAFAPITIGGLNLDRTITATVGAVTINQVAGTANIGAAGTTVTVTNSLCTVNSIILANIRTNDSTATGIKNIVPGAGSFVITLNAAATAQLSIGWALTN